MERRAVQQLQSFKAYLVFVCLIATHFCFYIALADKVSDNGIDKSFLTNQAKSNSKRSSLANNKITSNTNQTNSNYFHANFLDKKLNNQIQLYAFERKFVLNLKQINNNLFLSPNLNYLNQNNKYSKLFSSNSCFYSGQVDDDSDSSVYLNLCHQGHIIGSFSVNSQDYYIGPVEEFDSSLYEQNEFSFVDFDLTDPSLVSHLVYTKKSASLYDSKEFASCEFIEDESTVLKKQNPNAEYSIQNSNHTNSKRFRRNSNYYPYIVDRRIYLELLVVVDEKMFEYYGEHLENHILTLMFMTTQVYQHHSLINPVRIYISDIVYIHRLEERYRENLDMVWDAEKLLTNFCRWQHEYRRETGKNTQVDVALLITKRDICKSKEVCQTLGMARLNQVCVPGQNCAVIEDSGINTAYTIAHEIGHLLGMKHVEEERCKDIDHRATQMMASMLDLTKKTQVWTNCSVMELNDFLRTGNAECLFNFPEKNPNFINKNLAFEDTLEQFEPRTIYNGVYPGHHPMYELKNQCQQIFGPESDACEQTLDDDCKILWCKADSSDLEDPNIYQCVTTNTRWADGTPCGLNSPQSLYNKKICMNGECVNERSYEIVPVDGGWGSWSEFTRCSRTCGGGIQKRYRACDNPRPQNGGKYCYGERVMYESCNTQECPTKENSYRDEQCRIAAQKMSTMKLADQMGYTINNSFAWKAYFSHDPRRRCVLFCRIEEKSTFAILAPLVTDGTKCGLDSYDICVNGHCLPGGCDNVLYSTKSDDNCGICGGENKSCVETHDVIESPVRFGYSYLKTLPARSTNILIHRQRDSDDLGCLALRSNTTSLLNGYYVISKTSTSINFEGKIIDYIVNDTDEIIKSRGNFSQQLIVEFLAAAKKIHSNIKFTYYTPINDMGENEKYSPRKVFTFDQYEQSDMEEKRSSNTLGSRSDSEYYGNELPVKTTKSQCDKLCNGEQKITYKKCKRNDRRDCRSTVESKPCNMDCDLSLSTSYAGCTPLYAECGEGIEEIKIDCYKVSKQTSEVTIVNLQYCDESQIRAVNASRKRCYIPCDNYEWRPIELECSCENGYKKHNYVCVSKTQNRIVSSSKCKDIAKPSLSLHILCDASCYKWRTSEWTDCTKTCGGGERRRELYCVYNNTKIVDKSYCNSERPPNDKELCNTHMCPTWSSGPWNECYGSCERGRRNRKVICVYNGVQVDQYLCAANLSKPREEEDCETSECTSWKTTEWSECSATCGKGFRSRLVYCELERKYLNKNRQINARKNPNTRDLAVFERVDDSKCDQNFRPTDKTDCMLVESCPEWRMTAWSYCNCESGYRSRMVYCSSNTLASCSPQTKPASSENCSCSGRWKVSKWSECSGGCNFGWKFRNATCTNRIGEQTNPKECSNRTKPETRQRCFDCVGKWRTGEWSECSTSCGQGTQSRNVDCFHPYTNSLIATHKCDQAQKPNVQQACFVQDCKKEITYEWKIVSRRPCTKTCGLGWRFRKIECISSEGKESSLCDPDKKPDYYEQCDAGDCPKWEVGVWSTCSTDCGEGKRQRLVVCRNSDGVVLEDEKCELSEKPDSVINCTGLFCARWVTGKWSDCEYKTCTMVRTVMCGYDNGTTLPENNCNLHEKPIYLSECASRISCSRFANDIILINEQTSSIGVLSYTNWSKCSVKCGLGFRTREAVCRLAKNTSIELPMRYCNGDSKEKLRMSCNLANCSYQIIEKWGKCSAKCGQHGIEVLERKCYESVTKNYADLSKCQILNSTNDIRSCYKPCIRHVKAVYEWKATPWKECSAKCGFGYKNRTTFCWNISENKTVEDTNCLIRNKPVTALPCLNISCGYGWFVSKWSECSKNCSQGFKKRDVYCIKISKEGNIMNSTSNKCSPDEKPASIMSCNYGECGGNYFWRTGNWSKCAPSCGFGHQRRSIYCVDKNGVSQKDFSRCNHDTMPLKHQFCFTNCYAESCSDLKKVFGVNTDGDYNLNISNKIVQIYCKDMNYTEPKEYITLKSGESKNFAEIYDKKLLQPLKCRYGPRYGAKCSFCQNEIVQNHGITLFSKVRFNTTSLKIIQDDFSFANVLYGNPVPFGTSGDCYSSMPECQQGRLNIDLRGTNFVFDSSVRWINFGEKPHQRIYFSKDNSSVYGTCGGLCGFCRPDPSIGMKLKPV